MNNILNFILHFYEIKKKKKRAMINLFIIKIISKQYVSLWKKIIVNYPGFFLFFFFFILFN